MVSTPSPKITILLASHNRADLVLETLISISAQTYTNWECIIIDDYSKDNSITVITEYLKLDSRFSLYLKTSKYKKGLSGSRNMGLDIAEEREAQYIQFFDDDDLMDPEKLKLQIAPFIKNPSLRFSVCKYEKIKYSNLGKYEVIREDLELSHPHIGDAILRGDLRMNSLAPLWNFEIINEFRFDESLNYAEEWELFSRIGYHYPANYAIVDEFLFQYRKHSESLTLGEDPNFERFKSTAVAKTKLFKYITHNHLHTKKSILYFSMNFMMYNYQPNYLEDLIAYVKGDSRFSKSLLLYLKSLKFFSVFNRKVFSKLASRV